MLEKVIKGQGNSDNSAKSKEKPEFKYDVSDNEEAELPIAEKDSMKSSPNESPEMAKSDEKLKSSDHSSGKMSGDDPDDPQLQKVFVEELGKELLMDKEGNLFDLEGNFIGKANNDDDEEEGEMPDLP